jgi:cytochrome c-type biogenesis protein CcmH
MNELVRLPVVLAVFILMQGATYGARAVQPDEVLKNPELESQARQISAELRCLVCQNQSIDDSDAPLARDLRLIVRERLQSGDSRAQVIDFVVARYGEFILLRPRLSPKTYVLWLAPLLLLGGGVVLAYQQFRREGRLADPASIGLSENEQTKLRNILERTHD